MFQDSVIDLGVTLGGELTMSSHVGNTCRSGFYHLLLFRLLFIIYRKLQSTIRYFGRQVVAHPTHRLFQFVQKFTGATVTYRRLFD